MHSYFKTKRPAQAIALSILVTAASQAAAQQLMLEEVVVTAQKRVQNLQDVPISVAALSGDAIIKQGITGLDDLSSFVPNLNIVQGASVQIRMRGLGSGLNKGFEQSVGMYVDGIYYGRDRLYRGPLMDLERVEVLRGPQAILFGKNTIAGAINVTTAKPTDEFAADLLFKSGDYGQREVRATISGPLTDSLRGRLAVIDNHEDGYVRDSLDGGKAPETDNQTLRGSLQWEPSANWLVNLKLETGKYDVAGTTSQVTDFGPFEDMLSFYDPAIEDQHNKRNSHDSVWGNLELDTDTDIASLAVEYALGEHTLTSITGFVSYDSVDGLGDRSPVPLLYQWQTQDYEQFSQELRLTSPGGETLDYIVGAYYQENSLDYVTRTLIDLHPLAGFLPSGLPFGTIFDNPYAQDSDSWAVFGEFTWHMTEKLSITGGLRYTDESKDVVGHNEVQELDGSPGGVITQIVFGGFAVNYKFKDSRDESNVTPLFKAQYLFNDDIMGYFTASTGFKGGGYNMNTGNPETQPIEYDEEEAEAIEVGLKSTLLGGAATLNVAVFRTEFDDLQVSGFDGVAAFVVGNAAKAVTQGIELDGQWRVTDRLILGGSYGYLDAEYDDYLTAPCTALQISAGCIAQDLSGERLPFAPEHSANVNLDYTYPLGDNYELGFRANMNYSDEMFLQLDNDPIDSDDSVTKVDARLSLYSLEHDWELSVIGRNLTDERIKGNAVDLPLLAAGAHVSDLGRPRWLSVEFSIHW